MNYEDAYGKYGKHRGHTKDRVDKNGDPIEFKLTFVQWAEIWLASGHWEDRGVGSGKYNMCRKGDVGHYEVGNVFVGCHVKNVVYASVGRTFKHTEEAKRKISAAQTGVPHSKAHCAAISRALTGIAMRDETKAKLSAMNKGKPKKRVTCDVCEFETSPQNMGRHKKSKHGDGYGTAKKGRHYPPPVGEVDERY